MNTELIDYPMWHALNNQTELYNFFLKKESSGAPGVTIRSHVGKNLTASCTKHTNAVNKYLAKELWQKSANFQSADCEYLDAKYLCEIIGRSAGMLSIFEYQYCAVICKLLKMPDKMALNKTAIEIEVKSTFPGTRSGFLVVTVYGVPFVYSRALPIDTGYCLNTDFIHIEVIQPTVVINSYYETTLAFVCTNDLAHTKINLKKEVN